MMIIRNKKIIGLISITVGICIIGFLVYVSKVMFTGQKTEAVVSGFVVHQNGAKKVANNASLKNPFKGRSPFVHFTTEKGQVIETYSKVPQLFNLTGYGIDEKVTVLYNTEYPQQIFLLDRREIPGMLLMLLFGVLLMAMGKSFLCATHKKSSL